MTEAVTERKEETASRETEVTTGMLFPFEGAGWGRVVGGGGGSSNDDLIEGISCIVLT